jgi:hypothetical protein
MGIYLFSRGFAPLASLANLAGGLKSFCFLLSPTFQFINRAGHQKLSKLT